VCVCVTPATAVFLYR